ncbi:MAG: hypothetical protein INF52_08075 [Rhodobacter sp.]|nr:hypothetical protein [Rhodobacter sp.]
MVDLAGIDSKKSLEAWLQSRSREDAICIAHRAAMRVTPLLFAALPGAGTQQGQITALSYLWPIVATGAACKFTSQTINSAAEVAASAAPEIPHHPDIIFALSAVLDAAKTVYAARTRTEGAHLAAIAVHDASVATSVDPRGGLEFWTCIRRDCAALEEGIDPMVLSLWGDRMHSNFTRHWDWTRMQWAKAGGPVWAFWRQFYENALAGRPQDWPLLHDIALIPAEDWHGGPDRVHPIIEAMLLERAIKATPNAERITLNPDTGKLRVETISSLPPNHLRDAVDRLRDAAAIFDGIDGCNNSYALILTDVAILRDGLDRYSIRPNMLVVTCKRVVQRVETKIASGDCPRNDALVGDFLAEVAGVISDLVIFDPEVREAASARATFRLSEVSPEEGKTLERAADEVALASEGVLADEVPRDARTVSDPTRSEAERKDALFQTASRFFRVQALVKGYKAVRTAIKEAADVSKDISSIAKALTWLSAVAAILLKLFL